MISEALFDVVACPDCGGRLTPHDALVRCAGCGRTFPASEGYLDLRPREAFAEQTKYLDEALHVDARHLSIAPPLLGSKVRNDMLRRFLRLGRDDRVIDLGCGSGRALAWNADSGAALTGIDISAHFAAEALARLDLVLGDLRRLPLRSGVFTKAWSLDVLEHLSPPALGDVLAEANRVLTDQGVLFIYTHVRKNGWSAGLVRAVNRLAAWLERRGLLDLSRERLRKSDHLNPLADHDDLARVLGEHGFRLERVTYYTPVIGAFVENILVRLVEHRLAARVAGAASSSAEEAVREARRSAQARLSRRGPTYLAVRALSVLMRLDVILFGRVRSGPFFALVRKVGPVRGSGREA